MNLGGGDRRRIGILQGRNRLKGAQNNILRLKGSSLVSLTIISHTQTVCKSHSEKKRERIEKNETFSFFFFKNLYPLHLIPDNEKYDTNDHEQQPRKEDCTTAVGLFLAQLAFAILRIAFVLFSTQRNQRLKRPFQHVAYAKKRTFRSDKHHPRKQYHEYTCRKECIVQKLYICFRIPREEPFDYKHGED